MFTNRIINLLTKVLPATPIRSLSTVTRSVTINPSPILQNFVYSNNPWIWQKQEPMKTPVIHINQIILPIKQSIEEPIGINIEKVIEDPLLINNERKEAVRLIVIRRKKMKKHKLKKLRKRMKYAWAKVRQRRELKKEKEFQAVLIKQCKVAEAFSAEEYVANKIKEATVEPPLPFHQTELYKELMRRKRLRVDVNKLELNK